MTDKEGLPALKARLYWYDTIFREIYLESILPEIKIPLPRDFSAFSSAFPPINFGGIQNIIFRFEGISPMLRPGELLDENKHVAVYRKRGR